MTVPKNNRDYQINVEFPRMKEMRHAMRLTLAGINGSQISRNMFVQELYDLDEMLLLKLSEMVTCEYQRRWQVEQEHKNL